MILGRWLGWLIVLGGLTVLGRDALGWLDTRRPQELTVGAVWAALSPASLAALRPDLARWQIEAALAWWAAPVLLAIGIALLVLCRRRAPALRKRRRRR